MPGNDTVLHQIDARGVATVTLNRPPVGNAYDGALIDGLIDTFARLEPRGRACAASCCAAPGGISRPGPTLPF